MGVNLILINVYLIYILYYIRALFRAKRKTNILYFQTLTTHQVYAQNRAEPRFILFILQFIIILSRTMFLNDNYNKNTDSDCIK